jgi:Uma2 family endonuclease
MALTVELPDAKTQVQFNLVRWDEILTDPELAQLPYRIETDQYGNILMSPPPAFTHSLRQAQITVLLNQFLPEGRTVSECPVSTAGGVKAIDVAWLAGKREEIINKPSVLTKAPEICVEILSPSNKSDEIHDKRMLYFDAGATEVWICELDGSVTVYSDGDNRITKSAICPDFPSQIK